jgi:hypothetical protein
MQAYNKLWAALAVPAILTIAGAFGITPDMPFEEVVTIIVTAAAVWYVPNKQ